MAAGIIAPLISGGLSLLGGFGAKQSAEKQAKQQAINDAAARKYNEQAQHNVNMMNKELGERLLQEKAKTTTTEHQGGSQTQTSAVESTQTSATTQDNYSYVDVKGMMQAAQDAGFNPVTWLNAGGMQAYTQTGSRGTSVSTQTTAGVDRTDYDVTKTSVEEKEGHNAAAAYALMSPEAALTTASQAVNIPSELSILADAGKAAFNTYQDAAKRQQSQDFQRGLLGLQLAAINKAKSGGGGYGMTDADFLGPSQVLSPSSWNGGTGTPSYSTNGGTTSNSTGGALPGTGLSSQLTDDNFGSTGLSAIGSSNNAITGWDTSGYKRQPTFFDKDFENEDPNASGLKVEEPTTINPWQKILPAWRQHPDWPSGQSVEDQIGEGPFSWLYAPITLANNTAYSLTGYGFEAPLSMAKQSAKNLASQVGDLGRAIEANKPNVPKALSDMGFVSPFWRSMGEPISMKPYFPPQTGGWGGPGTPGAIGNMDSSIKAGPR